MFDDFSLVQRSEVIRGLCEGKRVLHLGCTNYPFTETSIEGGTFLHSELGEIASELWGLDSDEKGLEILRTKGFTKVIQGDLEHLELVDIEGDFDVIIAGEIIEHLNNPGLFLSGIRRLMSSETLLVITTVNAYCAMRFFWYGFRGKGGRVEFVHPDHVAYYSYSTLRLLVDRSSMTIDNFYFYDIGLEHRPHNRWILNLINDICVWFAPNWADGIIAVCRNRESESG